MNVPKIAIIISSTRSSRVGAQAARYVESIASKRNDMKFEIVDLRDYPLPLLMNWLQMLTFLHKIP